MNKTEAARAIKTLQRGQQRQLKLLDAADVRLGAPYIGACLGLVDVPTWPAA